MSRNRIAVLFVGTLLVLAGATRSFAQITNKGKDFWVGYGHHQFMETNRSMDMVLYLSAEDTATVTVTIYGSGGGFGPGTSPEWKRVYKMKKNTVISTGETDADDWAPKTGPNAIPSKGPMPKGQAASGWDAFYNCTLYDSWGAEPPANAPTPFRKKAIHITSTADVVAYAHIYGSASSGATMLLPTKAWGYNYTAINNKQQYAANCYGWMYVMADHDNTYLEITPSQNTKGGRTANVPFYVTLNRGEIYQIAGVTTGSTGVELTGTRVRSLAKPGTNECYPVAVFCGSSRTSNPANCGSGGGDNDNQQMFPQEAWGKRYLLAPLSGSTSPGNLMINMYKIVTNDPATVVRRKVGAGPLTTMSPASSNANGAIYYFESNTPDYIESDKPIMVAQFMSGGSSCLAGGVGDPEMIYMSPIEQAIDRIGFYRNTYENIVVNYVTMVIPTNGISSLRIDGTPFASIPAAEKYSAAIASLPGYSMVSKRWAVTPKAPGAQCIITSDSMFNAVTYGLGSVESYGYNAGTHLNNLNIKPSIRNKPDTSATREHPFSCTGTIFDLSIYAAYKPYKIDWQLSQVPAISPNADVSIGNLTAALVPIDTQYFDGVAYYKYQAPGGPYKFSTTGEHVIPVRLYSPTIENCYSREDLEVSIIVKQTPFGGYSTTMTGCPADSVRFKGVDNDPNFTIDQWKWSFPGGLTAEGLNAAAILPVGDNTIKLTAITKEGCTHDSTFTVTVAPGATADYSISKQKVCVGEEVTFTPSPSLSGSKFNWDFGDGKKDSTTSNVAVKHIYQQFDTVITSLKLSAAGNCSPISSKELIIKANPKLAISYPAGCLPVNGRVQFTSNSTVADGQTISSYNWNFGDANATPGNPNTSVAANPMHTYQYGTYDIAYSATTNEGCKTDTLIKATFNIKPDLAFASLPEMCQNEPAASIAKALVQNGVPGTGSYKGPATTSAGNFDPKAAGPGVHTIWWIFSATSGCIDSVSQTVRVNAAPIPGFTYPTGCLPVTNLAQFTNKTIISDGQAMTWQWNFNDANASGSNPNTSTQMSPSHVYSAFGTYNVKLTATSAKNCVADTTIAVSLAIRPQLSFAALANACENAVNLTVARATVTNGVTGTGKYTGPGTDSLGNFKPAVAGLGEHDINYYYTAQGGCIDSAAQKISVYAQPNASFAFPQGCLPKNNTVLFTNETTIADGQSLSYSWNFDDANATGGNPNTSTAVNPTHVYNREGNYNVKLAVASQQGCLDDTTILANLAVRPVLAYTALGTICENVKNATVAKASVTNGVSGTGTYTGPGTDAAGNFDPVAAGPGTHTIKYVFQGTAGCVDSISQTVNVYAAPVPFFTFPQGCLPLDNKVQFNNATTIADAQTLSWSWNFDDPNATGANPNTSTQKNPIHTYNTEGNYNVKLQVTSQRGCIADTTILANLAIRPVLAFPAMVSICENTKNATVAKASVTNGVSGTGTYTGPGTDAAGNFDPVAAGPGTHTIKYLFRGTAGCVDSVSQTVSVFAAPKPGFTFPQGCLPVDNKVQFNNTSTIADAQSLSWSWTFDDPNATGANPNTSTVKNPTHFYNQEGQFNVKLAVTSQQGCMADTTVRANLAVRPSLAFSALDAVCGNDAALSVEQAAVTNGVTGSAMYRGPGTSSSGQFTPKTAGAGTHTIWYVFASNGGCTDSISQTIQVKAVPVASFTSTADICLDGLASITDKSTLAGGSISAWNWSFGDGTTQVRNNGNSFTRGYTNAGSYNIKLTVNGSNGCKSDTVTMATMVNPLPAASFSKPTHVCMPEGKAQFTNSTTIAGGGSLVYAWSFGDNATATTKDPLHIYQSGGVYEIKLTATSNKGCVSIKTDTLRTFYDQPVAAFTATPAELCQGNPSSFTDNSTAPNSSISSWYWSFGDGTTSSNSSNTKTYTNAGNYLVKLAVKNAVGCVSDTAVTPVTVYLQPVIDAGKGFIAKPGKVVTFGATSNSPSLSFRWSPAAGLDNPNQLRPNLTVSGDQTYTLVATGEHGCTATDTLRVTLQGKVVIPNAFSPNGDGINDYWLLQYINTYPLAEIEVFDRYGRIVYRGTYSSRPWDGTYQNQGNPLPVAVYYYVVNLKDNETPPITGSITLIR